METTSGRERIAVVICDDDPTFARRLAKLLEHEAGDVEVVATVSSGAEAEGLVAELLPEVLLIDVRMALFDDISVSRICAASPTTAAVALTARQTFRQLATGNVVSDSELAEILGAVRAVCRGHMK